jgi:small-conductance mechanosensitive channel
MVGVFALTGLLAAGFNMRVVTASTSGMAQAQAQARDKDYVSQEQHKEIEDRLGELERRTDAMESRQIDVLTKLAAVDTSLQDLKTSSDKRGESLTAIIVGVAVLLIEMLLRGLIRLKANTK